jgi:hypothetical protein
MNRGKIVLYFEGLHGAKIQRFLVPITTGIVKKDPNNIWR